MSAAAKCARQDRAFDVAARTQHALAGHSGARLMLHAGRGRSFVRKTAAGPSHNERFLGQIEKQRHLRRAGIAFPQVLMSGFDADGCAFFDMAYIPGRTLADAVAHSAAVAPDAVLSAVGRMLWLFQNCRGAPLDAALFHGKIDGIANTACADADDALADAIRTCSELLMRQNWDGIPQSPSHGDLTLENIMLGADRGVVFIDCDEPWVSSYWLDMGKLFQDLYGHWCLRRLYASNDDAVQRANAIEKMAQLAALFRRLVARAEPALPERLHQLAALNLFRALPYAAGRGTASFICSRIRRVLER